MQTISPNTLSSILYYKDIPVFRYSIRYPVFTSDCSRAAAARINAHYADLAAGKEDYCRTVLYPQAVEAARYIQDNHPPFEMYGFTTDYEVTFNSGCITSLYTDESAYMGGAHGSVTRSSDTWDFASGKRLQLGDFYPGQPFFSQGIIQQIENQAALVIKSSGSPYYEDYPALLYSAFRADSFFLTQDGVVIYYQQYDIAPYGAGIPEFLIPFSQDSPLFIKPPAAGNSQ